MATQFVKFFGPHLLGGRELLNPGSVVEFDETLADELVKRGMGVLTDGPAFRAPGHPSGHGSKADGTPLINRPFGSVAAPPAQEDAEPQKPAAAPPVERADLGEKLARAERAVARPQQATGAI